MSLNSSSFPYFSTMKIAILHEMLIKLGWAEKVVESLMKLFPEADLYTLIYDETKVGEIFPKNKIASVCHKLWTQKIYTLTKKQRLCLPLMARSVESLDFSTYDRVIVSSSAFAHGLITKPETKTIVYYHAPARYMWDRTHEHTRDIGLDTWIRWYIFSKLLLNLRQWDYMAGQRNDILLANSSNTQWRITKYFRRDSKVLYPPVETDRFAKKLISSPKEESSTWKYYIIISALTEFKKLDIAVRAFWEMDGVFLKVIWDGNYRSELEKVSKKNVSLLWAQFWDDLVTLVQWSLGLIFPGEEDFGIVPIEVMAAGKPVFALAKWGLLESVVAWKTWEFFQDPQGDDFIKKFQAFHKKNIDWEYSPKNCQQQAQKFSEDKFHQKIQEIIK